jgi:hypothetical protein
MVNFRLLVIVACLSVLCSLFSGVVFALDSNEALDSSEARVSVGWSPNILYRGINATANVLFINDSPEEITIYYFGLHFDWMESDNFIGYDLSNEPVTIASSEGTTFTPVPIQVPLNATIGPHTYFVGIDGVKGESADFIWNSTIFTKNILNSAQEVYDNLVSQVDVEISKAVDANYQSPEAQSYLTKAETAHSNALNFADDQELDQAISLLQSASFYIGQAENLEQNYVPPKNDDDNQNNQDLLILVIALVAFMVVIVLVIYLTRKGKQTPPMEQPTET